jgi:DNA processing protein
MGIGDDLIHTLSLSMVPQVGHVHARILMDHYGSAASVFRARRRELESIPGIGPLRARNIFEFRGQGKAEAEIVWAERHSVRLHIYGTPSYPRRLSHIPDGPLVIFSKGEMNPDPSKAVAIIGTRKPTDAGIQITNKIVSGLHQHGVQIISGLAQGIDTEAHKASIRNQLETVGVLGHGLNIIYPPANARLASQMLTKGGLISEFQSGTLPDASNFPRRNRIVAGLADAVIVIETDVRGGSMITANLAFGYDRDLFAIPGRITDDKSAGCNLLISMNKATLTTGPEDIIRVMNWDLPKSPKQNRQIPLFSELEDDEKKIVEALRSSENLDLDSIGIAAGLRSSRLAATLLGLEMKCLIRSLPGKRFTLV